MKPLLSTILLLALATCLSAQKPKNEIEVKPYIRMDWYPEFSYNYGERVNTDRLTMQGTSWGVDVNYKIRTKRKINYKLGLGYMRYRFNNLNNINRFGRQNGRLITYGFGGDLQVGTDNYAYNIIPVNLGLEKVFELKSNLYFTAGVEVNNFFTFSQSYHLPTYNKNYKRKDWSSFGNSVQMAFGVRKQNNRSGFAPLLTLPIYTSWQKDEAFKENKNEKRSKWFSGFSIGFQYNYSIKK